MRKENNIQYDSDIIKQTADELIYLMGSTWEENTDGYLADESGKTLGESIRSILAKNLQIADQQARSSHLSEDISNALYQLIVESD